MERTCRELSENPDWVLVKGTSDLTVIRGALVSVRAGSGPVGEGAFSIEEDRAKVGEALVMALRRKLLSLLKAQDFSGYRALLSQQPMLLRGLKCDLFEPVPVLEDIGDIARRFFCQNGFRSIQDVDNHGWMPLHYAAVCGDGALVQSLLALEADPNQPTQKANPSLGLEARVLPLSLSCFFGHNDVVQLLISSKSTLISKAMVYRPLHSAAGAGNKEAVRMLCEASCRLEYNSLGLSALQAASFQPAVEVVDELLGHARAATLDVSEGLYYAVLGFAGSEMIYRLVEMKADVNIQSDQHWRRTPLVRAVYLAKYLQHRFYKATPLSRCCYHAQGATPLMFAMLNSNHECAAALIASGARLDLRNWRGCTAADLARHHFLPDFLKEAFEGRVEACRRVALLARGFVEVSHV